jgi:uncharacterized membrane protein YhhN
MPRSLLFLAACAAALDLAVAAAGLPALRAVTKPLPALLLALAAYRSKAPLAFALGLVFAAAGDELLLRDGDAAFMAGMAAFAAMHVSYVAAFARLGDGAGLLHRAPWLALGYAAAAIGMDAVLWPHAGRFAPPIAVYSVLLAVMAASALNAAGRLQNVRAAVLLAGGALVFMGSDTLLAFAKFWPGFPLAGVPAELAIVGSYFIAQIAIAEGVISSRTS